MSQKSWEEKHYSQQEMISRLWKTQFREIHLFAELAWDCSVTRFVEISPLRQKKLNVLGISLVTILHLAKLEIYFVKYFKFLGKFSLF